MQAKEIGKKIYVTSLHDYIFGDKAVIQSRDYLAESKKKEDISSSIEKIQEKVQINREKKESERQMIFILLCRIKNYLSSFVVRCVSLTPQILKHSYLEIPLMT
ncbi:MAG: hypothetical protein H0U57_03460 [Tatlockia sp.]|nr:hypothetical protein [Tatlockia sp.]